MRGWIKSTATHYNIISYKHAFGQVLHQLFMSFLNIAYDHAAVRAQPWPNPLNNIGLSASNNKSSQCHALYTRSDSPRDRLRYAIRCPPLPKTVQRNDSFEGGIRRSASSASLSVLRMRITTIIPRISASYIMEIPHFCERSAARLCAVTIIL